ncbi:hypothetical protein BDY19DRAFT_1039123 [Irpex rosettiformis]|uniref:Uncharacterized protein n=1 Tax=Irpex rosettiformis TaxID=378272 RepID=A0ACB8ULI4_9APHY|nr:hypothetical protein BDY19DRAFT_1039123 [Irpex rosettiformis]
MSLAAPLEPLPMLPPGPFDDFAGFDPSMNHLFPSPPPLPSSADLFSASETTDLLGFLDNFSWDVESEVQTSFSIQPNGQQPLPAEPAPPAPMTLQTALARSFPQQESKVSDANVASSSQPEGGRPIRTQRRASNASSASTQASNEGSSARPKPLLSTPQKRLNHIMSEQKRRNAIRDGYVQLTTLLSPAGAPPGAGMPTRGRPKGSGTRGNGRGRGTAGFKGKSGILFRAVEYIHWLEEGQNALEEEVRKVETAAGAAPS